MIPFARIVQYGNVVVPEVTKIKKMEFGNQHYLLLNSKGELYGSGNNANRQFLSSVTTNGQWNLIETGVQDCWAGGQWSMYKKDNKIYHIGTNGISIGSFTIYTEITAAQLGSVQINDIINIFGTVGMVHVSTINGNIYAIGSNTNGNSGLNNGTTTVSVLTQVPGLNGNTANVAKYMRYAQDGTAILQMTGGYLYGWGKNSSGMLATGNQLALGSAKAISFGARGACVGYSAMTYMAASGLWSCGDQVYGQTGTGYVAGSSSYLTAIQKANYAGVTGTTIIPPMGGGRTWNNSFMDSQGVWGSGINCQYLGNTVNGTLGSFTRFNNPVAFDNVVAYGASNAMSTICSDTEIYQCGNNQYMIGGGGNTVIYGFTKVSLPWE